MDAAAILLSPLQKLKSAAAPSKSRLNSTRSISPIRHTASPRRDLTPANLTATIGDTKRSRKRKIKSRVDILEEIEHSLKHMRREKLEYFEFKKKYYTEKSAKDAKKMSELKEINSCLKKLYEKVCPKNPDAKT